MCNCSKKESANLRRLELEMAHVVGVPRRDPCQKCQLPVFLAERLTVGKKVFHRTCLKCARCGSQLTVGSFYETEVDDVFCCETCPDEEEFEDNLNNEASTSTSAILRQDDKEQETTSSKTVRSSIADRLAFFEQNKSNANETTSSKLLEKSLSDEEKTKNLQQTIATTSSYKKNMALSSFLNDTIDGGEPENEDSSEPSSTVDGVPEKDASAMETTDSEETDENEAIERVTDLRDCQMPELPKTQPPMDEFKATKESNEQSSKRFTATAQLQLSITNIDDVEIERLEPTTTPDNLKSSKALQAVNDVNEKPNNNQHESEITNSMPTTEAHKSQTHKSENYLDLSATNINESVTKDISADATQTSEENEDNKVVELRRQSPDEIAESTQLGDRATTERLSVVRARLQQFEEITNNNNNNNYNLKSLSPEKDNLIQNNTNEQIKLDVDTTVGTANDVDNDNANENINTTTKTSDTMENTKSHIENIKTEMPKNMQQEMKDEINATIETVVLPQPSPRHVPLKMETKDDTIASKEIVAQESKLEAKQSIESIEPVKPIVLGSPTKTPSKSKTDDYPEDLNPFKSDDDDDDEVANKENAGSHYSISKKSEKSENSNPFDSSDDEIELEKSYHSTSTNGSMTKTNSAGKIRPPRPPPPRISRNPFDEDDDDEQNFSRHSSLTSSAKKKTPVPTPRTNLSQSQNPTPEATPRLSNKTSPHSLGLHNSSDYYGSVNSLGATTPLHRNSDIRGSNNSLTSSSGGTVRSRKSRKAPAPPQPPTVKELFPSTETLGSSKTSTPSSSTVGSPKLSRKKRPAPAPPKPSRLESNILPQITHDHELNGSGPKNLHSYPLQSNSESKLSDEEKALLEGKTESSSVKLRSKNNHYNQDEKLAVVSRRNSRRLIPLDPTLIKDAAENAHEAQCDDQKQQLIDQDEHNVVYRRVIMPTSLNTPTHERNPLLDSLRSQDRQSEKLKDNKEAKNRNRQSQQSASSGAEDADTAIYNKSVHGKWKRRKGPAPALPIPPRKVLQMLPLQEIRHELEIIEVQQQGLEKQGVVLEKMIRDRCEGQCGELLNPVATNSLSGAGDGITNRSEGVQNSKEVEDLILQLFELVNEKNELFRRQAELMYLRRQHRLEQEQADLEYEIRVLMAQPERNKTDSDKAREEALIARLVKVVQLRNEVVECLEMDRLREAEEDLSIKQRLEQHTAKRNGSHSDESGKKSASKLSKKEKKKQKEAKKLSKNKKIDADKDADESELTTEKQKLKKKRRKFLF